MNKKPTAKKIYDAIGAGYGYNGSEQQCIEIINSIISDSDLLSKAFAAGRSKMSFEEFLKSVPEAHANNAVEEYKANKCNEEGRVMFPVYSLVSPSGKSAFGENKCSRCGYTEPWQYDF